MKLRSQYLPLLPVWEDPVSSIGLGTGYPNWGFSWFSSWWSAKYCESIL